MSARCLIQGEPTTSLAADDRGLYYGDGLFETIRVLHGRAPLWSRHMARLGEGCRRLKLPMPDPELLQREISAVSGDLHAAVVRITWTRGSGPRGYRPPTEPSCTRMVRASPAAVNCGDAETDGIRVRLCDTRLAIQPALAGLKHLNRLEQVLARAEWHDPDIAEGVMCNTRGQVISATAANLFVRLEEGWITPDVRDCGVAGVARAEVLAQWPQCRIGSIEVDALMQAEEMFLSSSVRGVLPVTRLVDRGLSIGSATRAMQDHFAALLEFDA